MGSDSCVLANIENIYTVEMHGLHRGERPKSGLCYRLEKWTVTAATGKKLAMIPVTTYANDGDKVVQTVSTGALCTEVVTTNGWDDTTDSKVGDNGFNGKCNKPTDANGKSFASDASNGNGWDKTIHSGADAKQKYHSYNFKDPGFKGAR